MILVFLGSWRSTLIIAVSIPLSILTSLIVLSALGETINIMTLGGLALAVGILVDDATVEIENINRNIDQGKEIVQAILDGAQQIAVPALVSTLCICIVFVPMFFLSGVARYLFVPLAEAVVSRCWRPICFRARSCRPWPDICWSRRRRTTRDAARSLAQSVRAHAAKIRSRDSSGCATATTGCSDALHPPPRCLHVVLFSGLPAVPSLLLPFVGEDFFPTRGQRRIQAAHARADRHAHRGNRRPLRPRGRRHPAGRFPPSELVSIIDNIGLPYSGINLSYSTSAPIGPGDADIHVELTKNHRPDSRVRPRLAPEAGARIFRESLSIPARGHRQPDSQFRPARAD